MGLKSFEKPEKKPAMVLILILMIITTLSIFIIGAMKIFTSSNGEFSINRNATEESSIKVLGKFICYKKVVNGVSKLYQQRIEYNTDGSIKTKQEEKEVSECTFIIPEGIRSYEVTLVGGGGSGSASSMEYTLLDNNGQDCFRDYFIGFLKATGFKMEYKYNYIWESQKATCYNKDCLLTTDSNKPCKFSEDDNKFKDFSGFIGDADDKAPQDTGATVVKDKMYTNSIKELKCNYEINDNYDKFDDTVTQEKILEIQKGTELLGTINPNPNSDIKQSIQNIYTNKFNCTVKRPQYEVNVGNRGTAGSVNTKSINSAIYGSGGNTTITIPANYIGEGGKASDAIGQGTNGGQTKFEYYHKNIKSKEYKKITILADGGQTGSSKKSVIDSSNEAGKPINSEAGKLPLYFTIPSEFNIGEQLYSGSYEQYNPKSATYFGSSGASGYISAMDSGYLTDNYYRLEIDGKLYSTSGGSQNACPDTNPSSNKCKQNTKGTDGAPGAIIISW